MIEDFAALGLFLLANLAVAGSGAFFRPGQWYEQLRKPGWRPPNWLFGPVWSILYLMIAVAGWLIWRAAGDTAAGQAALAVYAVQLLFNAGWSAVFFGLRRPDLGLIEVLLLWSAILATILLFLSIRPLAGYLLVPYLIWVSFATLLNFSIWRLNRQPPPA